MIGKVKGEKVGDIFGEFIDKGNMRDNQEEDNMNKLLRRQQIYIWCILAFIVVVIGIILAKMFGL